MPTQFNETENVMSNYIPVNEPLLDGNEAVYLKYCIDTGWISSEGPFVAQLEEGMANYVGVAHGIAVANGTVALDLAIEALGLAEGDEVIIPTFTIISCALPLVRRGITPVCVDCDPNTFNMQVADIEALITPKTRAIMAVHIYGLPVDMDPLLELARVHNLYVIEDAAEAHGIHYKGKQCGSFGDLSILSFYPNKHVTTGEGGMVLTSDDELAARCRSLRNLCFGQTRFVHEEMGFNYRMSNLQAAVGCAQLERLDQFVEQKREMGARYTEMLSPLTDYLQLPVDCLEYRDSQLVSQNGYWVYPIVLKPTLGFDAVEFAARLGAAGIGSRPFFYPMHLQPCFTNRGLFAGVSLPNAEHIARFGLYLPSGLGLTRVQQNRVVEVCKKCL